MTWSMINEGEQFWVGKGGQTDRASADGNNRDLYILIRSNDQGIRQFTDSLSTLSPKTLSKALWGYVQLTESNYRLSIYTSNLKKFQSEMTLIEETELRKNKITEANGHPCLSSNRVTKSKHRS